MMHFPTTFLNRRRPGTGLFLTACLALAGYGLQAQPTLTATGNAVTAPLPYAFWGAPAAIPEGPSGAGLTWDFSRYNSRPIDENGLVACASTPFCGLVTQQGTIADTANSIFRYLVNTGTGIEQVAEVSFNPDGPDTFLTTYTNTDLRMKFPFTYQDHYNDRHEGFVYDNGMLIYNSVGYDSVYADGWGTVITPGGTFSNVLRIRQTFVDSSVDNGILYGILRKDRTDWYQPGSPTPVFRIETDSLLSPVLQEPLGWSWYGYNKNAVPNRTGIPQLSAAGPAATVYPNPADQVFRLATQGITNQSFLVRICDMAGRTVYTQSCQAGNNGFDETIDPGRLPSGIYQVSIAAGALRCNTRLAIR